MTVQNQVRHSQHIVTNEQAPQQIVLQVSNEEIVVDNSQTPKPSKITHSSHHGANEMSHITIDHSRMQQQVVRLQLYIYFEIFLIFKFQCCRVLK